MHSYGIVSLVVVCSFAYSTFGAEFVPSQDSLIGKAAQLPPVRPEHLQGLDISKLTPAQKHMLAIRMELLRRRRAEATAPAPKGSSSENEESEDLETAHTFYGGGAFPFLGLYGLGLGGLGVGLGPLAYAGLFG